MAGITYALLEQRADARTGCASAQTTRGQQFLLDTVMDVTLNIATQFEPRYRARMRKYATQCYEQGLASGRRANP